MTTQTQFAVGDRVGWETDRGLQGTVLNPIVSEANSYDEPRITVRWDNRDRDNVSYPILRKLVLIAPAGPDRIEELFS